MFEQDRLLVRLQQRVMSEIQIAICFLSGSYGRREEDGYSDMDVALIFKSDVRRDEAWANRRAFVRSITPYVPAKSFDAHHVRPYFHIALYSNGTKVDYRYELQEELEPNPWDRDLRIIKDADGWAAQYQAACAQIVPTLPRLESDELSQLDERFWIMFWDVFRLVLRGDMDKPFPIYLELLHTTLPALMTVLPESSTERANLLSAHFNQNAQLTRQHLQRLLEAYISARNLVVQKLHLDIKFDSKFETAVLNKVNNLV